MQSEQLGPPSLVRKETGKSIWDVLISRYIQGEWQHREKKEQLSGGRDNKERAI